MTLGPPRWADRSTDLRSMRAARSPMASTGLGASASRVRHLASRFGLRAERSVCRRGRSGLERRRCHRTQTVPGSRDRHSAHWAAVGGYARNCRRSGPTRAARSQRAPSTSRPCATPSPRWLGPRPKPGAGSVPASSASDSSPPWPVLVRAIIPYGRRHPLTAASRGPLGTRRRVSRCCGPGSRRASRVPFGAMGEEAADGLGPVGRESTPPDGNR